MKKILLIIMMFFMIPVIVNADACNNEKVSITSISLKEKSLNVLEVNDATASGRDINLGLAMYEVGDYIEYLVEVKNDSKDDYEIISGDLNLESDYINYSIISEDGNSVVKSNSTKKVYLRAEYKKVVPDNIYDLGTFNDNQIITVQLSTSDRSLLTNPNTGINPIMIAIIVLIISGVCFVIKNERKTAVFIFLVIGSLIIPVYVSALCKCEIKVNSDVIIGQTPYTGVIYRHNDWAVGVGDSIRPLEYWVIADEAEIFGSFDEFESKADCERGIDEILITEEGFIPEESVLYCKKKVRSAGFYTTKASDLHKNYYIRNEVENDIITKQQICFVTDKEVCLNDPGIDTPAYMRERDILYAEKDWFEAHGGTCVDYGYDKITCTGAGFDKVYIGWMTGYAYVQVDGYQCTSSYCFVNLYN